MDDNRLSPEYKKNIANLSGVLFAEQFLVYAYTRLLETTGQRDADRIISEAVKKVLGENDTVETANENITNLRAEANAAHKANREAFGAIREAIKNNDLAGLAAYVDGKENEVEL